MKQIRTRLTYANVMSSIAVFLVIGGGAAFAATQLPPNSVGTPQIKRNAVKTGKVAFEAIRAGKLAKNAVSTNRLRDNAVTGAKVKESTLGTVPDAEKLGGKDAGEYLRSPVRRVEAISAVTTASGQFRNVTASCPEGERAIGGGAMWTQLTGSPTGFNIIQGSRPVPFGEGTDTTTGWQATGISDNAAERQLRAYVLCIPQ